MKRILFIFNILITCVISAQNLKIMTYNIRYDNTHDGVNSWTNGNRKEKVFQIIHSQNPDILGVQEALHHQLIALEEVLPLHQKVGVGRDDGKTDGEYAAIFFRRDKFTLLEQGNFWLSQTPETPSKGWDAACYRICTWVKLQYEKEILFVFNTHLDHEGVEAQKESTDLILQKIKSIAGENKLILMGDFNMTPENTAIQKLSKHLTNTQLSSKNKTPKLGTYNDFNLNEPVIRNIDYFFVKNIKKITDFKILDTRIDGLYPSDHFPVVMRIKL